MYDSKIKSKKDVKCMLRFYTYAEGYEYPLVKITQLKKLEKVTYQSAIIDVGIYDLVLKYKDKPFPSERIDATWNLLNSENLDSRWLIATVDYPALSEEFNIRTEYDNVKLTLDNWRRFSSAKKWKQGIYTLQSRSISDYDEIVADYEKFPLQLNNSDIPVVGVGSLCRLIKGSKKEKELVENLLRFVRNRYQNSWIHVWGGSLHHIKAMKKYANSFDNTKWTRPVDKKVLPNRSCRQKERLLYLSVYLKRIQYLLNQQD